MKIKKILLRFVVLIAILAFLGVLFPAFKEEMIRLFFMVFGYLGATIEHNWKMQKS